MSTQVYYTKSMNGINSFDDGSGTVIEDGKITTTSLNINSFNASTLTSGTITTNTITAIDATVTHDLNVFNDIHGAFLRVDNTITGGFISLNDQFGSFYGQNIDTNISAGDVNLYNSTYNLSLNVGGNTDNINIGNDDRIGVQLGTKYKFKNLNLETTVDGQTYGLMNNMVTSNLRIGHSMASGVMAIANNKTSGDVNIMNNLPSSGNFNFGDNCDGAMNLMRNSTSTGYINMCNTFKIFRHNFEFYTGINPSFNFCNNLLSSNTMQIGGAGNIILCNSLKITSNTIASTNVNDTINLFNNITSGSVQIGNSSVPSLIKIGNFLKVNGYELSGGFANDTIGLFPTQTGGEIQLGSGLTTGVCLIGHNMTTGYVQLGPKYKIQGSNIINSGINDVLNVFNTITTGAANIATGLTSGTCYLGGLGNIRVGNVFTFKNENITSSGIADSINVFNNITTGTINFCNGLTSGLLQIGAGKIKFGTSQIWGYTKFGTSTTAFTIPSTINNDYFFVATGTLGGQVITLPSYIDGQIIRIRNNKLSGSCVIQCFGTQSLTLKNNGTATNITVGNNTTTILIGTATTWFYFL